MPKPTPSQVHVDSALTSVSVAYIQDTADFVSHQVFANVPVRKQSDRYFVYDRGDFNRDEAAKRAPATESAGGGFSIDNTPNYFADVWAWHHDVDDQVRANSDEAHDPEDVAAQFVTQKLLIRREKNFVTNFMTGGVWDNDFDGVASSPGSTETIQWSDQTNGDPIGDIRAAKTTVKQNTGFAPNTLVVGQQVFDELVDHPDVVDRVKYSGGVRNDQPAMISEQTLAALFGLNRVMVASGVENTAAEDATESGAFIVGKKALLCYVNPTPSLLTPSAGYTFSWRDYLDADNEFGIAVSRIEMPNLKATRVEGEMAFDQKLVASSLGYFWDSIVA